MNLRLVTLGALALVTAGAALITACSQKPGDPDIIDSTAVSKDDEAHLVFSDDFDGTKLDRKKWKKCPEQLRQGPDCIWDDDMTSLDGEGHLVLRAEWDPVNKRVRSGGIRSKGKFEYGYGYYEASCKFPAAYGIWGAFWMMCGDVSERSLDGAGGIEIDVIESIRASQNACNHALHWGGYGDKHKSESHDMKKPDIYDGEFHTFGLERTPEEYIFYIDRVETWRTKAEGVCPEKGYMKLTVESAKWAGAGKQEAIDALPAEMLVDKVCVWDKRPFNQ